MVFTSLKFILFITATVTIYFLFPKKYRWVWLLIASYFFYLSASIKYGVFLVFSTAVTFFAAICMEKTAQKSNISALPKEQRKEAKKRLQKRKKLIVALAIILNFAVLFFIKYYNFTVLNISALAGVFGIEFSPVLSNLLLPVGISFYTFQVTGYVIDVYREINAPEHNFFKYALFVSFFPQIMQGPIGRFSPLSQTLYEGHAFEYERMTRGLQRMVFGFFEKLVIADRLAIAVDTVWADYMSYGKIELLLACLFYAIQIYADFAGYMDIALGASEIMGIRLSENFKAPYFSASIPEFWRRWHITLGSWFRDYLFYPVMRSGWCSKLGKSLKEKFGKKMSGRVTTVIALMCVWFFTGMWHGASWHYIIWGVYYGILIILSTLMSPVFDGFVQKHSIDRNKPFYKSVQILKTFALVCLGYIFFRSTGMTQAFGIIGRIFTGSAPLASPAGIGLDRADLLVALIAVAVLIIIDIYRAKDIDIRKSVAEKPLAVRWTLYFIMLFSVIIFGIYGPGYSSSSFIYFQF